MIRDIKFGTLTRLFSEHQNLRTDEIIGAFFMEPRVGFGFTFYSYPLTGISIEYGNVRAITTTRSLDVWREAKNTIRFDTVNSRYLLVLSEQRDEILSRMLEYSVL